jgi:hypothetical protein
MLTPQEWFQDHFDEQARLKEEKRVGLYKAKKAAWEKNRKTILEAYMKEKEAARQERKRDRKRKDDEEEKDLTESELGIPPPPKLAEQEVDWEDAEPPMYFTETKPLMDIFSSLEEQNLFLIQNSQETEHTLEELRHAYKETKLTMDARTGVLESQINDLQQAIDAEENGIKALMQQKTGGPIEVVSEDPAHRDKERMLSDLNVKVRHVCEQCDIDVSSKPSTLFMLSSLESKLEVLLSDIEKMPVEYVIKVEKEKEKRRRERKREEQQQLQIRQQEERNRRAIERSMQAPKKRTGRQIMQRSKPVRKEAAQAVDTGDEDNNDEMKFLT